MWECLTIILLLHKIDNLEMRLQIYNQFANQPDLNHNLFPQNH